MATLIRNTHQDSLCFCWRSCRSWQFWSWLIWFSLSWWLLWFWWASQALNKASSWAETETLMSLKQNHSKKFCEFGNFPFQPLSHPFPPTPRPHRVPGCVWGILLWLWTWNNTATCFKKKHTNTTNQLDYFRRKIHYISTSMWTHDRCSYFH